MNLVVSFAPVLRSGGRLLHPGAEDQHVEGGAGLGKSLDIHLRPLVSRSDGGAPDCSGGAQETQPGLLQGDPPYRLQAGPDRLQERQH